MTKSERFLGESLKRLKSGRVKSVQQQGLADMAELKLALEPTRFVSSIINARSFAFAYLEYDAPEDIAEVDTFILLQYRPMIPRETFVLAAGLEQKEVYELVTMLCLGLQRGRDFRKKHGFREGLMSRAFKREMF